MPSLEAITPLIDKISQRQLLSKLQISCPRWILLSSLDNNDIKLPTGMYFPLMAKSGKGGYDGKGTYKVKDYSSLFELLNKVNPDEWLLESWVEYDKELSIVASRDLNGKIRTFPLIETYQSQQICDWTFVPASVSSQVEIMAYNVVSSLMVELDYVGVIAIEFFYGPNGLEVNEIAPRTHNSGHFSIDACNSSQFDQQICIVSGKNVPEPKLTSPGAIMVNLLGLPEGKNLPIEERLNKIRKINGSHLHWYGKEVEKRGRKLGHVTILLNETDQLAREDEAIKAVEDIRSIWPMP